MPDEIVIPEGFTRWDGGECPAKKSARVEYILRCGYSGKCPADRLFWGHAGFAGDIIAYRVLP